MLRSGIAEKSTSRDHKSWFMNIKRAFLELAELGAQLLDNFFPHDADKFIANTVRRDFVRNGERGYIYGTYVMNIPEHYLTMRAIIELSHNS